MLKICHQKKKVINVTTAWAFNAENATDILLDNDEIQTKVLIIEIVL